MSERDYSICAETDDGKHRPRDGYDPEMPPGYATIECSACGQTTGIKIPSYDDIEWG